MKRAIVALAVVLVIAGCDFKYVVSFTSLGTAEERVVLGGLEGTWGWGADNAATLTFTEREDRAYDVQFRSEVPEPLRGNLIGEVFRIGDLLFLQVRLAEDYQHPHPIYGIHLAPVNSFLRIALKGDTLEAWALAPDWLAPRVAEDAEQQEIPARVLKNQIVLTGSRAQVRAFLEKYGDDAEAFPKAEVLERKISLKSK
ncbi:MAG: hypothetical protein IT368_09610 [Candidatus Hydrogenedentes bacterium]|nr:hypothetical protein [Candidatus Hydrogenedentota bacterium]